MANRRVCVLLHSGRAAFHALGRLSGALGHEISEDRVAAELLFAEVEATDLLLTSQFYLNTLSRFSAGLEKETVALQQQLGLACLGFLTKYAAAVNRWLGPGQQQQQQQQQKKNGGGKDGSSAVVEGSRAAVDGLFAPGQIVVKASLSPIIPSLNTVGLTPLWFLLL